MVTLMLLNLADIKRQKWLGVALLAFGSSASASNGELNVSGRLLHRPDRGQCVAQLIRPAGERVATAVISGEFSVQLPYALGEGPYLINVTCDGYRVQTSRSLTLNSASDSLAIGTIDPNQNLDADGCRELDGEEAASVLKPMISAFEQRKFAPITKVHIGAPNECTDEAYVLLRGLDEYSGPGMHWIISMKKDSGQVTIEQGL